MGSDILKEEPYQYQESKESIFDSFDEEKKDVNDTTTTTEVKIRITRKELEELLGKVDLQKMGVEEILAQLLNASHSHQQAWRPVLQTIPEIN
ncbi:hypothetical protein GIB67_011460 [Kingdonia uniflora]|uniref:Uncharacterized protein n=1 Tax=Kingdonia uniflora TaxID=39325 RepID=A0A7J7NLL5_9MAGN|nr:hypothetical protein GIB67_011460 [Kingdonia uniflora]